MITFNGTREELYRVLALLPRLMSGEIAVPGRLLLAIHLRIGVALLSQIQQDFITKSRGGTGRDGIKWKPLARATIAARRITVEERRAAGVGGRRERGLLTPAENRQWRGIFASTLARMRAKGMANAEALAAQTAWAIMKSRGAKTRLALFGGRTVDIGRDTSRMFRSLTPGVEDRPSNEPEQIFMTIPGGAIVGSNVPYFEDFHRVRHVWPYDGTVPQAWMDACILAAVRGILEAIRELLASGWRP